MRCVQGFKLYEENAGAIEIYYQLCIIEPMKVNTQTQAQKNIDDFYQKASKVIEIA